MVAFTQIKETCLYADDLAPIKEFYHGLLGLEVISDMEGKLLFFRVGSSVLLFFNRSESRRQAALPPHEGHGPIHFAFEVKKEDYDSCRREIASKGISIIHDEAWPKGGRSFYFHDPAGHVLEVEDGIWD